MAHLKYDLTGETFGLYTVLNRSDKKNGKSIFWECKCACGTIKHLDGGDLRKGSCTRCKSCGNRDRILKKPRKPDKGKIPEYRTWIRMKMRCLNPKDKSYKYYGGRGIKICELWINSYESFIEHIGLRPSPDFTIDRINTNGNYEPGNVRWATRKQQSQNRNKNGFLTRKL